MSTWGGPGVSGAAATGVPISAAGGGRDAVVDRLRDQLGDPTGERGDSGPEWDVPGDFDRTCSGWTTHLEVPASEASLSATDVDAQFRLGSRTDLPEGGYLLTCEGPGTCGRTVVRFEGPASVERTDSTVAVSFWDETRVAAGRQADAPGTPGTITVPDTLEGVATAITHLSAAHRTSGPARSHPDYRDHPPLVRVGETTDVPATVRDARPATDLTLRVPRSVEALFVGAPLAYYLGAAVSVEDRCSPALTAGQTDVDYAFDPLPEFQHQAAQLLRRVFFLDCRVRRVATDDEELTSLDLNADQLVEGGPAKRLERYLSVPWHDLDPRLPEWHLSTYVEPGAARARCLPYLLDRLSLVYLPRASQLDSSDLLDRTLGQAYPVRGGSVASAVESGDVVQPDLQAGRVHAWLAPGTPIDAFKTTPSAYENQFRYSERDSERLQVAVILNDERMGDEQDTVEAVYRDRAANLPIDVDVHDRLTRAELEDLLSTEHDFVHYIGHCDESGLRCPDGNLAAESLERARTRTFFLNACGSYEQGIDLVEQGAITGAVTFSDVLDSQAARVGTAFARLLVHGFSFERALQLARRRIVMGMDYAVVGDGTYSLLPSPGQPVVVHLVETEDGDGGYRVICEVLNARSNGIRYRLPFGDETALNGATAETTVTASRLRDALEDLAVPVVYEGDVHWSDELVDEV